MHEYSGDGKSKHVLICNWQNHQPFLSKDEVVVWLAGCLHMEGELQVEESLNHFLKMIRLPNNNWEEYLQVAQVQLIQQVCH